MNKQAIPILPTEAVQREAANATADTSGPGSSEKTNDSSGKESDKVKKKVVDSKNVKVVLLNNNKKG